MSASQQLSGRERTELRNILCRASAVNLLQIVLNAIEKHRGLVEKPIYEEAKQICNSIDIKNDDTEDDDTEDEDDEDEDIEEGDGDGASTEANGTDVHRGGNESSGGQDIPRSTVESMSFGSWGTDPYIMSLLDPAIGPLVTTTSRLSPKKRKATEAILTLAERQVDGQSVLKRLRRYHQSLLARCVRCGALCDKEDSIDEVCTYHDGELELEDPDGEFPDDDRPFEELISNETKIENLGAFTWGCCDETGKADGCQRQRHIFVGRKTHYCELEMLKEMKSRHTQLVVL
ncbi:hypothetical protein LTS08_002374 [Lithohypha guttulata]|nr:hypothetical protein LTS08_002374 [Lithohypha guttulata]